jgi:ABC-2 type transport system ATP-binding protein
MICDHVVVIDGGRLLRSTSTADMTSASGAVAVEVTARADQLAALLQRAGLAVQPAGRRGDGFVGDTTVLEVELADETTYDLIRDTVAQLGVGLVRMQRRRHHIVEIFQDAAGGQA